MSIGERIREKRKAAQMTLDQLAQKINSSKSYIWEIENNKKSISAEKLLDIAKNLDTTTDYLLDGTLFRQSDNPDLPQDDTDQAFFRKYSNMPKTSREKLQKMLEILDDEDE